MPPGLCTTESRPSQPGRLCITPSSAVTCLCEHCCSVRMIGPMTSSARGAFAPREPHSLFLHLLQVFVYLLLSGEVFPNCPVLHDTHLISAFPTSHFSASLFFFIYVHVWHTVSARIHSRDRNNVMTTEHLIERTLNQALRHMKKPKKKKKRQLMFYHSSNYRSS